MVKRGRKSQFDTAKRLRVVHLYGTGASLSEIGGVFGVSKTTIRRVLIEEGVDLRSRGRVKGTPMPTKPVDTSPKPVPVVEEEEKPEPPTVFNQETAEKVTGKEKPILRF